MASKSESFATEVARARLEPCGPRGIGGEKGPTGHGQQWVTGKGGDVGGGRERGTSVLGHPAWQGGRPRAYSIPSRTAAPLALATEGPDLRVPLSPPAPGPPLRQCVAISIVLGCAYLATVLRYQQLLLVCSLGSARGCPGSTCISPVCAGKVYSLSLSPASAVIDFLSLRSNGQ